MKLHEKIYYYRKRAGLSQDALAEKLGVSRQAISKWETADSVPETGKLMALASALGITVDELLSEDGPEDGGDAGRGHGPPDDRPLMSEDAAEALPGLIKLLVRRWGWLAGVYVIRHGAIVFLGGALVNLITLPSFKHSQQLIDRYPFLSETYGMTGTEGNLLTIVATIVSVLGLAIISAGIALTVYLKRRRTTQGGKK